MNNSRLQDRVHGTLAAWKTDAAKLRESLQEGLRDNAGNLLICSALSKCIDSIDEAVKHVDSAALVLVILGLSIKEGDDQCQH